MLKRPTSRRKSSSEGIVLNLVPILDTMVTLIGFLLYTTAFFSLVSIESPFPTASTEEVQQKLKEKPLQLTLTLRDTEAEIWSPFEKIKSRTIPNASPGKPDIVKIHSELLDVKKDFPNETKVVIVPTAGMTYDILISVMDGIRGVDPTDPPLFTKNLATGNDEPVKILFPEVIFGNLLGDT
ncbi:MAG: biopolymer transporter ExbD [Oligoflexia bacterium]|nr:biopolymer transporter ExbD [Oligoflexia bacterium]